ncbi:uncharacterized protein LOC144651177 isoform X2 [Oculina patagonica]
MHYTTSLSPGLQPVLHNKDSTPASTDSSMSRGQASFAAALRKLAKQAKPVPSSASSPAPSDSSSQSVSPSVSAVSGKSAGMSPSRTSPSVAQTEMNTKDRGDRQSPGVIAIRTPPVPPISALDPDHRNHRPGDPNRGPQRPEVSHPRMGHEVMPGVYASMPRGHSEVPMLSEHYPGTEPPHAPVAFYPAYGAKPDLPIYVPRGAHPPGPPPLLASKRDGPEAHMLPAFYPTPYPPPVMDPHDVRFNSWRQQRAAEHLRQQHERHSILPDGTIIVEPYDIPVGHVGDAARHLPPGSVESFVRKNSPHLRPGDNPESRETRKQETSESTKKDKENDSAQGEPKRSSGEGPLQRGLYHEHKQGSCPVHGHGTPGAAPTSSASEPPRSHGLHVRADPALVSKLGRPGEYKRMFLPAHDVPVLHPYLVHPPRDALYPLHPLDERHAEFVRERERQEFLLHERLMFEQKEGLRAPGEDWPRHHMPQEKPGGIGVVHYPQPLHQQRLDASKSPHSVDHHKGDPSLARMVAGREAEHLYRGFPFHPFHPPPPDGKGFGDRYGNELDLRHLHPESVRRPAGGPSERLGMRETPYLDSHPFSREVLHGNVQRVERAGIGEREWQRRDRVALVNGDYQPDVPRPKSSDRSSPSLTKRIKVERTMEEPPVKAAVKIRHNPYKLKFLEGLGLVTVDKKKEMSQGGTTLKRKYEGDHNNENGVDSPNNLTNDSDVNGNQDDNIENTPPPLPSAEKLDFMATLGLLPPSKRQELEQSYEIKRTERKNRKSRGRPPKRARRDKENDRDSDNSQGSLDPDAITGPITRQKQQLLQEQERKENKNKDADKQQPVNIKTEDGEKRIAQYPHERTFRRGSDERYRQSPTMSSSTNHLPPRLTLQSLTNMEDPFSNISASQFRPPYLRHTGLLSISHEHGNVASHARPDHRTVSQPIRPEPLRSMGISFSEQETRDYLSQHSTGIQGRQFGPLPLSEQQLGSRNKQEESTTKDEKNSSSGDKQGYKWTGIESVMQSYFTHAAERGLEIGVLQDNADVLKTKNLSLNEEAHALSIQMENLAQAKKELSKERTTLQEGLDKLHFFIESLKR